jgi:hypothetical protein
MPPELSNLSGLSPELVDFLQGRVMIIVGTQAGGRPEIARALGARVDAARRRVTLALSAFQWPEAVANLRSDPRLAVTFSRPYDYATYQLKGRATEVHAADGGQIAAASRYGRLMAAELAALGVAREVSAPWRVERDLVAVTMAVEAAFLQTPGRDAGRPIGAAPDDDRA